MIAVAAIIFLTPHDAAPSVGCMRHDNATMIALVGDDGRQPCVWGLGRTLKEATEDATRWLTECGCAHEVPSLKAHEISDEDAAVVHGGDISWPIRHQDVR